MINTHTVAFMKGEAAGYKFGMFRRYNPYNPNTMPSEFLEWEAGFTKGYQERGWL
ncbi:hypothetical protein P7_228 [Pectobacterium phage vB_PcaM_P7_Pc]|nr:hypothetical protein P7_228 [Pectobacterium phage vB_PcaM_P7_Pc]